MTTMEGYLDSATVLLFGLLVKLLLAVLFFVFWYRSRRAVWFAWWGVSLLLGAGAAGNILLRGFEPSFVSLGVTVAFMIAAFGSVWQGARAFERRAPLWPPFLGAVAIWLAFACAPGLFGHAPYRVVLSSLLVSSVMALTAVEFWRGRNERLPSRWMIIALSVSLSLFFAIRIPLVAVAPFPFGAQLAVPAWLSVYNMIMFSHTIVLVVLFVAITKERLEFEQRMAAYTDPLTGASNRRAFAVRGRRLLSRHERNKHELCALFLDIDDFKRHNDRMGHAGGDGVLKRFVEIVHDNIRPTDFLFRIGGEEFCCLLPQTDAQQGRLVAERIRHQVEAAAFDPADWRARVTVSIGVASTAVSDYSLDILLHEADIAVYEAKRQGRNRVVVAEAREAAAAAPLALAGFAPAGGRK